jgi:hypothetical protein
MKIAFALAWLAGSAAAHQNIPFEVRGPSGVQYSVTSSDNISRTGTMPAAQSAVSTVEGYHVHDGQEELRGSFTDGTGTVQCAAVPVGLFEPQFHFQTTCRPTFVFNQGGRTCASTCEVPTTPGPPDANAVPKAFPNPVRHGAEAMSFMNLPAHARVRIYSLSGRLIFDGASGPTGGLHWHCIDNAGRHVGPGVYVALIEGSDRPAIKLKIAVQH